MKSGTYNSRIQQELPVCHRVGTIQRKYEWAVYPDQRSAIMGHMADADLGEFLEQANSRLSENEPRLAHITANDFYRFCAMGYQACGYDIAEKSPKEQCGNIHE